MLARPTTKVLRQLTVCVALLTPQSANATTLSCPCTAAHISPRARPGPSAPRFTRFCSGSSTVALRTEHCAPEPRRTTWSSSVRCWPNHAPPIPSGTPPADDYSRRTSKACTSSHDHHRPATTPTLALNSHSGNSPMVVGKPIGLWYQHAPLGSRAGAGMPRVRQEAGEEAIFVPEPHASVRMAQAPTSASARSSLSRAWRHAGSADSPNCLVGICSCRIVISVLSPAGFSVTVTRLGWSGVLSASQVKTSRFGGSTSRYSPRTRMIDRTAL